MKIELSQYKIVPYDKNQTAFLCIVCGKSGWINNNVIFEGNEVPMHKKCRKIYLKLAHILQEEAQNE
jgi:hypothetical protein